ncbi:hypothetical protein CK227_24805 [Mesorhizobium sp. WSM4308]|nr:hypothetical protein CK232_24560 [Mesorhizobium sp. WSM4304]PBB72890.1 hypothetical protein CK227_24805 [Mesorhizobium sp. WSM4308]
MKTAFLLVALRDAARASPSASGQFYLTHATIRAVLLIGAGRRSAHKRYDCWDDILRIAKAIIAANHWRIATVRLERLLHDAQSIPHTWSG